MFNLIAVDDEKDVRVLFEHFFHDEVEDKKVNLIFVSSAQECLDQLHQLKGETIVLSDINMPDINGIELLKIINKDYPSVKVLLISAYDQDRYHQEMMTHGAKGYISKPVDFVALKDRVFELIV